MDIEEFVWIYIPILIGILEILISGISFIKEKKIIRFLLFIIIAFLNSLAIYILIQILNGAWPTYTPHIAIGISTIILLTKIIVEYRKRKKTFANTG
jgi:hypothetical protein